VATVLSAQCTDERVNQVTAQLFGRYRNASDYSAAPPSRLEADIRSTGFYRNKAKAIRGFCQALVERHDGEVPREMEELTGLPGVGRKTANLIRAEAFGLPGMVVDTHVRRLSQRLGMTDHSNPDKIEMDLVKLVPEKQWNTLSLRLIAHGRKVCKARSPLCHKCTLLKNCPTGVSRV
jgi:endonuclease-3